MCNKNGEETMNSDLKVTKVTVDDSGNVTLEYSNNTLQFWSKDSKGILQMTKPVSFSEFTKLHTRPTENV